MKVTIEVDCTPEEARRFMGLPDVTPVHESMVDQMKQAVSSGTPFMDPEKLLKAWMPVGTEAMEQFQRAFWSAAGTASPNADQDGDKENK